tara:strand:+ start:10925 stop:12295 length:1371 start_codon:yes stop_codon:yes gene_type:complete
MVCESKNKSNLKFENLKINGQYPLKGEVVISGAKNSALVLMAASLLTKEKIHLKNVPNLSDVEKMQNILKNMGVKITNFKKNELLIDPQYLRIGELPFDLVNGLRASFFCIGPLLAKLGQANLALPGGCNIGKRPINEHIDGLEKLGAAIEIEQNFVKAKINNSDRLIGTKIFLGCPSVGATETLIMAATLAKGITYIHNAAKEPEVKDLCDMLNKMGAKIKGAGESKITIHGVHKLRGCTHEVIPDRIEAGTFLIASAATHSSITIRNVIPGHLDSVINKLKESGSKFKIKDNSITIKTNQIKSVDITTSPFPGFPTDLQAPFTSLMAIAEGKSKINEKIFERRMNHIESLKMMGACIEVNKNIASIEGVKKLKGNIMEGLDLRSTAAIIIAALSASETSFIGGLEHLDRGYEDFELKLSKLGAKITRERILSNDKYQTPKNTKRTNNFDTFKAA